MIRSLLIAGTFLLYTEPTWSLNVIRGNSMVFDLGAKDKLKLESGKQKLYGKKYKSALSVFKEILIQNPTDGVVLFYCGECHYHLGEYDKAYEYFKKGKESQNPKTESIFYIGMIDMMHGKMDEALAEFQAYKLKATPKEVEENDVDLRISHCNNSKKYKEHPLDVKIENAGSAINSAYDDKAPSISADGRLLVFNSRRPETTDAPVDIEGDGKYFEDIYISHWDTVSHKWHAAEPVPGQINSERAHDACSSISADGKQIFIYKNDLNDPESRGGDIFVSKINNHKWKTPETMGKAINSTYWEGGACISPDGHTLFFLSERPGGFGQSDIWMITKLNKVDWGKPVNLGPEINTAYDEVGLFLAPDGKTLFFCSNNSNSMGSYDIFRTINENGKWTKPENLGYPINTEFRDGPLVLSADARYAYIASDRKGGLGESDIYKIDLKDYALLEKDFKHKTNNGLSILKGMVRDGFEGKGIENVEVEILSETGEKINSTHTNEHGEYFITLKGNMHYELKIVKAGYASLNEKINLLLGKAGETFTLEKQFLMNKEK